MRKERTQFDMQRFFLGILLLWRPVLSQVLFESLLSIDNKSLGGFVFQVINDVHSYFQCYKECEDQKHKACSSVNFYPSKGVCELSYASHVSHPNSMTGDGGATYLFNLAQREDVARLGKWSGLGGLAELPAKTCKILNDSYPLLPSGNYWLDVDLSGPIQPFLSYCDMETDGGGWTLVWSMTFNNYQNFKNKANYIKPVPTNMCIDPIQQSDTPPKNETDMNAIDFTIWKDIGSEFLVKSNINNWVACLPNGGSLVTKTSGNLDCRFIRQIVLQPNCTDVPMEIKVTWRYSYISLVGSTNVMYSFIAGEITTNWPTHDPCAQKAENHKKNVDNPHTNIYLR